MRLIKLRVLKGRLSRPKFMQSAHELMFLRFRRLEGRDTMRVRVMAPLRKEKEVVFGIVRVLIKRDETVYVMNNGYVFPILQVREFKQSYTCLSFLPV